MIYWSTSNANETLERIGWVVFRKGELLYWQRTDEHNSKTLYNHSSTTCLNTGCFRAFIWPPQTLRAGLSRVETSSASTTKLRWRSRWRILLRAALTMLNNRRLRPRLELRRTASTSRYIRHNRAINQQRFKAWDRNWVLLVTNGEVEKRLGTANNPVWAVVQGCEGRTNPISAIKQHVIRFPFEKIAWVVFRIGQLIYWQRTDEYNSKTMYNHNSTTCLNTGCFRAVTLG